MKFCQSCGMPLSPEVRALIATYGKQVDFVNLDTLEPIVKAL